HEASADDADPAQRESAVGTALPGTSAVAAFEDHAGRVAGGQHALVGGIEADGSDVLGGKAVEDVLPGGAAVGAAERAFAGGDHDLVSHLAIGSNRQAADADHVRGQA